MFQRLSRACTLVALVFAFGVTAMVVLGCNGASPFTAAAFNTTISNANTANPPGPPADPGGGVGAPPDDDDVVTSVCDLLPAEQIIQVSLQNAAQQIVEFSMTFVVSAGPGGFVCDEQLQDYLNAGYSDAIIPGSGASVTIGCDTLTLLSGTRLLTLEFGINQGGGAQLPPNVGGDPDAALPTLQLRRRDSGSPNIPLPELVVFGNDNPNYICIGGAAIGDLCTQRGFNYVSGAGLPVGKSPEASRIQGTICAENFGTAPEWRLDKTLDGLVQPFQYGRGGVIIATVLDRAADNLADTRNQVVWLVTDADDNTLHFPDP